MFTSKFDIGANFIQKLCDFYVPSPLRISSINPFSLASGSLCVKQRELFHNSDMLDISWHKGLYDSNILIGYRYPKPICLGQHSLTIQHLISPEVGIHGVPMNNFSQSVSQGLRLSKLSIGLDFNEPSTSNWSTSTGVYFKHNRFSNDSGRSISRDLDGFPLTCSGEPYDNMIVINQKTQFEDVNDHSFTHFSLQMEQGIPLQPNLLTFNRFKFFASKGVKLGPTVLSSWLSGGSIVGSIAPHQAFAIGGPNSVRGYGEGAVGSGQSYLASKTELAIPLNKKLEGVFFLDCGSDLNSSHRVPGNPGHRHGKPGSGYGIGCGIRFKTKLAQIKFDYAINAFHQRSLYFGISNLVL
ncbi:outer membrane OMP85 family protein [Medicago truncatula]|uniref:Outer membrane OMP85 family protein n=1 Tax=Medicago truncatula TaxID=3880 RepID=A0A072VWU6_MEDTR|nr:outer membrane OMP85 family protein [Medicago truncatula]